MIREIGSEYWNVPTIKQKNNIFPKCAQWYISGRSALNAIIEDIGNVKSVSMPSLSCGSMVKPFVDAGIEVHFYPVYWHDGLAQKINTDTDVLFIMDYFGYTTNSLDLESYKGFVIRDVTHSIFSSKYTDADYCFGSLRKWCGVWTGGYAWTKDEHSLPSTNANDFGYASLRKKAMLLKNSYINEQGVTDKAYLKIYEAAEQSLENVGIVSANERDVWKAQHLDLELIKKNRRSNAEVLMTALSEWVIFPKLTSTDVPMFVPILVPDGKRDALRQYLANHDIYCPIHWPISRYHKYDERTEYIYKNELSLVCDQRYSKDDMNRIVDTINAFRKEMC